MTTEPVVAQEARDQNVTVRVTRSEKKDVQLVAAFDQTTESDTLRAYTMTDIRSRADRIRQAKVA